MSRRTWGRLGELRDQTMNQISVCLVPARRRACGSCCLLLLLLGKHHQLGSCLTPDLVDQAGHLVVRLLADETQDEVDFGNGELELDDGFYGLHTSFFLIGL